MMSTGRSRPRQPGALLETWYATTVVVLCIGAGCSAGAASTGMGGRGAGGDGTGLDGGSDDIGIGMHAENQDARKRGVGRNAVEQIDASQCFTGKGQVENDDAGPVLHKRLITARDIACGDDVFDIAKHDPTGFRNDGMVVDDKYRTQ